MKSDILSQAWGFVILAGLAGLSVFVGWELHKHFGDDEDGPGDPEGTPDHIPDWLESYVSKLDQN